MNATPLHRATVQARQIAVLRALASLKKGQGDRHQLGAAEHCYLGPDSGRDLLTYTAGLEAVLLSALADGLVRKAKLHTPEGRQEYQITSKGRALLDDTSQETVRAKCSTCERPIIWVRTSSGKAMPVDPEAWTLAPGPGADVGVTLSGEIVRGTRGQSGLFGVGVAVHTSHFATCEQADLHRRRP